MNTIELAEIISKFEMPEGKYVIKKHDEFGESEFYWVVENQNDRSNFLLVNTYHHHGVEDEMSFYAKNGFTYIEPVLRKVKTLEYPKNASDDIFKYLYQTYSVFRIKKEQ